jgi:hypothetical protein
MVMRDVLGSVDWRGKYFTHHINISINNEEDNGHHSQPFAHIHANKTTMR